MCMYIYIYIYLYIYFVILTLGIEQDSEQARKHDNSTQYAMFEIKGFEINWE